MTTATSRIQRTIAEYRKRLMQHEQQAEAALNRAHGHTVVTYIQPSLDKFYGQIAARQQEILDSQEEGDTTPPTIPAAWLNEQRRLETIKSLISGQVDQYGAMAQATARQSQHVGVQLGLQSGQALLQASKPVGVSYTFGVPSTKAIANLVGVTQAGSPLSDLFAGFGREAAQKASQALVSGVTLGWNPRRIAPLVEEALGVSRNRALTIARDQLNNAYRQAAIQTYQANSDIMDGMVRIADLSPRTCAPCIVLNGTVYKLDDDPGFHTSDRCSLAPLTKSWSDILGPLGIDTSNIEDTRLDIQSGSDWFDQQDEATQRSILGNSGYDIWKNNEDVTLQDFVTHTHDEDWGNSIQVTPLKDLVK
jgi:SPP1 gp7 family putative phage head morphogenesis protein